MTCGAHGLAALFAAWSLTGCALLSKGEPLTPRYFTIDVPTPASAPAASPVATSAGAGRRLRLGRVTAAAELRERMVYREGDEIGFLDDRRWAERPASYLERALSEALFDRRGFVRAVAGAAPTLSAELLDFEETRGDHPSARVTVRFVLDDERSALAEGTVRIVEASSTGGGAGASASTEALVRAFGRALQRAVEQIADQTTAALPVQPPAQAAATP